MTDWKEYNIGQVSTLINGFAFKGEDFIDSGVPVLKIKNVKPHKLLLNEIAYVAVDTAKGKDRFRACANDLLITMSGNRSDGSPDSWVGKVCLFKIQGEYLVNQRVGIIRVDEKICSPRFLAYVLGSWDYQLHFIGLANSSGGQANISPEIIQNTRILLPPIFEQQAIANVLSSLDEKIDLLQQNNKTLEKLAEALFRQWFVVEANEDWEEDELGRIFDIGIGRTPPRAEKEWFSTNRADIKWVSIKDMGSSGLYISSTSEYLTREAVERFNIPVIPTNTVLLSFKMTIGRLAITTEEMLSNEAIAHFKLKTETSFFPEFLYLFLKTYKWEQLGSTSSIVDAINSKMIKEMLMVIPPVEKLHNFEKLIRPYFDKIKLNQYQIKNLLSLRDDLIPKLISGEVRVNLN